MRDGYYKTYNSIISTLKYRYFSLLPWMIYTVTGIALEIVGAWLFPVNISNPVLILYYALLVPHRILLISLVSLVLIKSVSVSKRSLLYFWRSYTPPFDSEVEILNESKPTEDLIRTAQDRGMLFFFIGFIIGAVIPSFGEVPLRQGSISFIDLPNLPYFETIAEIISGFPIVGDILVLSLISVQSTVMYIPISISAFLMLIGTWNLSYASGYFLQTNYEAGMQGRRVLFKILATLNGPLTIVYLYRIM